MIAGHFGFAAIVKSRERAAPLWALPLLPAQVTQQGIGVAKAQGDFLMVVALYDTSGRYSTIDIADYLRSFIVDPLARINGVGNLNITRRRRQERGPEILLGSHLDSVPRGGNFELLLFT